MKKITIFVILLIILGAVFGFFYFEKNNKGAAVDPFLDKIKQSGKLVVGVDFSYGVMEFFDENKNPVGIDIDIIKEIARRLGLEVDIKSYSWDELLAATKNGEIDLAISSITITAPRSKEMLFSAPYFNGGQVVIVKTDNSGISRLADLTNKKIGAQKDTTSYDEAIKLTAQDLIITYASWDNSDLSGGIISDLKEGKTEAVIVDYIQAISSVKDNPTLKIVGEPFTQEYYGLASKLDNTALIEEVNTILRDLKREGLLENIKNKWIKL